MTQVFRREAVRVYVREGTDVITGVVRLKDVLSHPIIMIHEYGLASYLTIILKGLSSHQYQFTSLVCSSPTGANSTPAKTRSSSS